MKKSTCLAILTAICGLLEFGCSDSDSAQNDRISNYGVSSEYSVTKNALNGWCKVTLDMGNGSTKTVDFETDYLPNVTYCELGGSNYEAMRAQAIIGRSFAYYHLNNGRKTLDVGTNDQVYSCPSYAPTQAQLEVCKKAVQDTSGIVVYRQDHLICTFYRSGCASDYLDSNCVYQGNSSCPAHAQDTEKKITHNWGKSGSNVTSLYKNGDPADSGCLSHNGAMCLSAKGWVYPNILKFFYGMDIELRQAEGTCIEQQRCETQLSGAETIIDDTDKCFTRKVSDNYFTMGTRIGSKAPKAGYDDTLQFAYTTADAASAEGTWHVSVKTPGTYQVFAYVDSKAGKLSKKAVYEVRADSENKKVTVDLNGTSEWVEIGKFKFAAGQDQWVKLTDATGEAYTDANGTRVVFDALKFVYTGSCTDECSKKDAKECSGNGFRVCGDANADGCLEWSDVTACGENEKCQKGSCSVPDAACEDECKKDEAECVSNNGGFRKCGQFDADECLEWSEVFNCGAGLICRDAACVANESLDCVNECQDGQKKCGKSGTMTCGQFDDDECLEWSEEKVCSAGTVCKNGECREEGADSDVDGMPDNCLTEVDGKETIIDEFDDCFVKTNSSKWLKLSDQGYDDHLYYSYVQKDKSDAAGTWYLNVTKSGTYQISVYIAGIIGDVAKEIEYTVKAGKRVYHPSIITSDKTDGWVVLGKYDLEEGELQYIELSDGGYSADDESNEMRVIFDAVKVEPKGSAGGNSEKNDDIKVQSSGSDCSVSGNWRNSSCLWMMMACFGGLVLLRRRKFSR